jgi:hypothetical protein
LTNFHFYLSKICDNYIKLAVPTEMKIL